MLKRMFIMIAAGIFIMSCGGNPGSSEKNPVSVEPASKEDITNSPTYKIGLELVAQNDCLTCHKVQEKLTGPAYAEIATRYANAADTTITNLAHKIIKGGMGNWGTIPMTPHSNLSEEDAEKMVRYVLLLKK